MFAKKNLLLAQMTQEYQYNQGTKICSFKPGDRILLLLPSTESKLLAKWQGPFEVARHVGPVDYEIKLLGCRKEVQIYHVNILKAWKAREALFITPVPQNPN